MLGFAVVVGHFWDCLIGRKYLDTNRDGLDTVLVDSRDGNGADWSELEVRVSLCGRQGSV